VDDHYYDSRASIVPWNSGVLVGFGISWVADFTGETGGEWTGCWIVDS